MPDYPEAAHIRVTEEMHEAVSELVDAKPELETESQAWRLLVRKGLEAENAVEFHQL
jgi:hypothetical protein